jgi:hypothetical protein
LSTNYKFFDGNERVLRVIALELMAIFNIYIIPTKTILRILHYIDSKLKNLIVWVKIEKEDEEEMKKLDAKQQKEEEIKNIKKTLLLF